MGIFDRFRRNGQVDKVPYHYDHEEEELEQLAWELGPDKEKWKLKGLKEHKHRGGGFGIYKEMSTLNGSMSRLIKVLDHLPSEARALPGSSKGGIPRLRMAQGNRIS